MNKTKLTKTAALLLVFMVLISCLGFNTQAQSGESVSFGSVYDLGDVIDFYAQLLKNIKSFDNKADESPSMTYEQWVATPDIPAYSGEDYIAVNDNIPFFTKDEKQNTAAFESYSELDPLGRCGAAYANICK